MFINEHDNCCFKRIEIMRDIAFRAQKRLIIDLKLL